MAQFLYDRGGFWQLKEYEECSFLPYRNVVEKIVEEERGHQSLGEKIVVDLVKTGGYEAVKQPMFDRWFRIGMLSFGRPDSPGNRYAMGVGLKKRDSGDVMQDFIADIKPCMRACGLKFQPIEQWNLDVPADLDLDALMHRHGAFGRRAGRQVRARDGRGLRDRRGLRAGARPCRRAGGARGPQDRAARGARARDRRRGRRGARVLVRRDEARPGRPRPSGSSRRRSARSRSS